MYWPLDNISIDPSLTLAGYKNWSWAVNQPWCSGTGTLSDPYIIENVTIQNSNLGISIRSSKKYFVIRDVTIYNVSTHGINLHMVHNGTIFDNNISFSDNNGIYLDASTFNHIKENFVSNNNDNGILLTDGSNNNTIETNTIINNLNNGISVWSFSHNNTIEANRIIDNRIGIDTADSDGIAIIENIVNSSSWGINVYEANFTKVMGNIVYNNSNDGLYMDSIYNSIISENIVYKNLVNGIHLTEYSANNNLTNNIIRDNKDNGIYISSSFTIDNLIWKNYFLRNGKHAIDNGNNNHWNITTIGNYWDNHTGPDTNPDDGIVDFPYYIGGTAGSIDYLPIAEEDAPSGGGIGLDYFMTGFFIFITGGMGVIIILVKIYTKKRIELS